MVARTYNVTNEDLEKIAEKNNIKNIDLEDLLAFSKELFQLGYGVGYNRAYRDILSSAL